MGNDERRITQMATCGGCSAKMSPADLREIIAGTGSARRDPERDPRLLVGTETGDDAAVYRLTDDLALVVTTDFITPVCDDPFLFGQVAAANALSDVYAMGGSPTVALAICGFPSELPGPVGHEIVAGGASKAAEAGAAVVGGHTIRNPELFYGLAVTGIVNPADVVRNAGARPGDALVLTKPLGTGLVINGVRAGKLDPERLTAVCRVMIELNREASVAMVENKAHAATDVTGFGLAGHALGMARGSGTTLRIRPTRLPVYEDALPLQRAGVKTKGTVTNHAHYHSSVRVGAGVDQDLAALIYDPQTAGGLLIAVDGDRADKFIETLHARGVTHAAIIGDVVAIEIDVGQSEASLLLQP
jgi:selenide,water dikinase